MLGIILACTQERAALGLGVGAATKIVQRQRQAVARRMFRRIQHERAAVVRLGLCQAPAAPQKVRKVQVKSGIRRIKFNAAPNQPLAFCGVAAFRADQPEKMRNRRLSARLFQEREAISFRLRQLSRIQQSRNAL
jgi:hypothetical protein